MCYEENASFQCAFSWHIVRPIFFYKTITTEVYLIVFKERYVQLADYEFKHRIFQQDGETCHKSFTSCSVFTQLLKMDEVSLGILPLRSLDLTECDLFLSGYYKSLYFV